MNNDNGRSYQAQDRAFLGTGLAFPVQLGPARRFRLVSGQEDIQQSIRIILGTMPGERVMRPEFGCRAYELLFDPHDTATEALLVFYVEQALARWEPRIEIQAVTIDDSAGDGRLPVTIHYRIKATHDERSIVYPFYLMEEQ